MIIAKLSSKIVKEPSDVINILEPAAYVPSSDSAESQPVITQTIRDAVYIRICRYLRSRRAHPEHERLNGVVTAQMREELLDDLTYRLRRFLLLVTGSQMLPGSDQQRLRVWDFFDNLIRFLMFFVFRSGSYTSIRTNRSEIRSASFFSTCLLH